MFKSDILMWSASLQDLLNNNSNNIKYVVTMIDNIIESNIQIDIGFDDISLYKNVIKKLIMKNYFEKIYRNILKPYFDIILNKKYDFYYGDGNLIYNRSYIKMDIYHLEISKIENIHFTLTFIFLFTSNLFLIINLF